MISKKGQTKSGREQKKQEKEDKNKKRKPQICHQWMVNFFWGRGGII